MQFSAAVRQHRAVHRRRLYGASLGRPTVRDQRRLRSRSSLLRPQCRKYLHDRAYLCGRFVRLQGVSSGGAGCGLGRWLRRFRGLTERGRWRPATRDGFLPARRRGTPKPTVGGCGSGKPSSGSDQARCLDAPRRRRPRSSPARPAATSSEPFARTEVPDALHPLLDGPAFGTWAVPAPESPLSTHVP